MEFNSRHRSSISYKLSFLFNGCYLQSGEAGLWGELETFLEPKLLSCSNSYKCVFARTMAATTGLVSTIQENWKRVLTRDKPAAGW